MCEACFCSLGLGTQGGREWEGASGGRGLPAPPATRLVSLVVFLCELKRGGAGKLVEAWEKQLARS